MREQITKYIKKKYVAIPEFLWKRFPGYAIFRHEDNKKWFALIGDVTPETSGLSGKERIDVVNIKIDDLLLRDILIKQEGYVCSEIIKELKEFQDNYLYDYSRFVKRRIF